jgi:hypothetical protein
MLMLAHAEKLAAKQGKRRRGESVGWTLNGTAFVIRDKERLISTWLPLYFGQSKFSSFTRKLYRWGFRKIGPPLLDLGKKRTDVTFGNQMFRRDNPGALPKMRSVTAAKARGLVPSGGGGAETYPPLLQLMQVVIARERAQALTNAALAAANAPQHTYASLLNYLASSPFASGALLQLQSSLWVYRADIRQHLAALAHPPPSLPGLANQTKMANIMDPRAQQSYGQMQQRQGDPLPLQSSLGLSRADVSQHLAALAHPPLTLSGLANQTDFHYSNMIDLRNQQSYGQLQQRQLHLQQELAEQDRLAAVAEMNMRLARPPST